jgi:hypothetical protein
MASRTGVLSDRHFDKVCFQYRALPMGYAQQAVDKMKKPPRVLDGVKIPKYSRPAARPISADVVAVNASHGSEIVADKLLDEYNPLAMKFVEARDDAPLPILAQTLLDDPIPVEDIEFIGGEDSDFDDDAFISVGRREATSSESSYESQIRSMAALNYTPRIRYITESPSTPTPLPINQRQYLSAARSPANVYSLPTPIPMRPLTGVTFGSDQMIQVPRNTGQLFQTMEEHLAARRERRASRRSREVTLDDIPPDEIREGRTRSQSNL